MRSILLWVRANPRFPTSQTHSLSPNAKSRYSKPEAQHDPTQSLGKVFPTKHSLQVKERTDLTHCKSSTLCKGMQRTPAQRMCPQVVLLAGKARGLAKKHNPIRRYQPLLVAVKPFSPALPASWQLPAPPLPSQHPLKAFEMPAREARRWVQLRPEAPRPPRREQHAAAYDSASGSWLLFGGAFSSGLGESQSFCNTSLGFRVGQGCAKNSFSSVPRRYGEPERPLDGTGWDGTGRDGDGRDGSSAITYRPLAPARYKEVELSPY